MAKYSAAIKNYEEFWEKKTINELIKRAKICQNLNKI